MNKDWKAWIMHKAEPLLGRETTPLPVKELAWKAVNFAVNCGISHPVSFALRPILMHSNLRLMVGVNLAIIVVLAAVFGPIPSLAENAGGPLAITIATEGEVKLITEATVAYPLPSQGLISQRFWLLHAGIDLPTSPGTPVSPVMAGMVTGVEFGRFGYGNKVVIAHKNGYSSLYAHLSKVSVSAGDSVTTNSIIGESGNTGRSTGPHLHLEIHLEGKAINPAPILGIK